MRVLHLIDTLDGGSARQLDLLTAALTTAGVAVEVCVLGPATRHVGAVRAAAIPVHVLGWTRWLDAAALLALRGMLRAGRFDLLHVWRMPTLRAVALAAPELLGRAVVRLQSSDPASLRWWERRLLGRVRAVVAASEGERTDWLRHGLDAARCTVVPPAVVGSAVPTATRPEQHIVCTGQLERGRGFRHAIWAVDVLRYVFPEVQLLIAGSGPHRPALMTMIERLNIDNARLLGDAAEPTELLSSAQVCWVPSRSNRGRHAALAALAAGRPVIASDVPCLRELIRDGVTGYLVPPGAPVALARRTRALLHDPDLRANLGSAARADMLERFALERVAGRWLDLYNAIAA